MNLYIYKLDSYNLLSLCQYKQHLDTPKPAGFPWTNKLVAILDPNIWINDDEMYVRIATATPHNSPQLWKHSQAFSAMGTLRIDSKIRRMRWERNTGQSLGLRSEQAEHSEMTNMKNAETTCNCTKPKPLPWKDRELRDVVCPISGKIAESGLSEISTPSSSAFTRDMSRCLLGVIFQIGGWTKAGYAGYGFARNIKKPICISSNSILRQVPSENCSRMQQQNQPIWVP